MRKSGSPNQGLSRTLKQLYRGRPYIRFARVPTTKRRVAFYFDVSIIVDYVEDNFVSSFDDED